MSTLRVWDGTQWVAHLSDMSGHNHDDRYYTEAEVNAQLAGKAASVHNHDSLFVHTDDRSVATIPNDYNDRFLTRFRSVSTLGLTSSGAYAQVVGYRAWNDSSGGKAHEIAYCDDGVWHRSGSTTTWGVWKKIVHDTAANIFEGDARLADARTPTAHTHDDRYYTETESDGRFVQLTGDQNIGGAKTFTGEKLFHTPASGNAGFEIGRLGVATTPYIDFHSGANNNDFDVRLIASGGGAAGVTGGGTLDITSASLKRNGQEVVVNNDARLADARTPTAHTHNAATDLTGTLNNDRLGEVVASRSTALNTQDWNALATAGVYQVGNWSGVNGPTGAYAYGTLIVTAESNRVTQWYVPHTTGTSGRIQVRSKFNASDWTSWRTLLVSSDIGTGSGQIPQLDGSGKLDIARIPTGTTSTTVSLGNHTHDDRYYTETESDSRFVNLIEAPAGGPKRVRGLTSMNNGSGNLVGSLVIQTNLTFSGHMCNIKVHGYNYESAESDVDLNITFYATGGGTPSFTRHEAVNKGAADIAQVRLMRRTSDSKVAIVIDTTAVGGYNWQYPKLAVEGIFGHTLPSDADLTGWTTSITSDLTAYTTMTTPVLRNLTLPVSGTSSTYLRGDRTWQSLSKSTVGLGNVDNTSDAAKPISTATQTALNGKANTSHTHTLANISDVTASAAELNLLDGATLSTTELNYVDGVTSSVQTQLNGKMDNSARGGANGVASLDANILVPISQLPTTTLASSSHVVRADDARLSDSRTPLSHTHTKSQITDFAHTHLSGDITDSSTKGQVRCATTTGVTLSGLFTVDGVNLVAGDRILVKNHTNPAQNGIYVTAAGAWSRATDADTSTKVAGTIVAIASGQNYGGTAWFCGMKSTDSIGVHAMNWVQVGEGNSAIPTISSLGDTQIVSLYDQQFLTYSTSMGKWANQSLSYSHIQGALQRAKASKNTTQSVTHTTDTKVTFQTEEYDTGNTLAVASNNFTMNRSTFVRVTAYVRWAGHATGRRVLFIRKNNVEVAGSYDSSGSATPIDQTVVWEGQVASSDVFDLWSLQTSGGALNINDSWMTVSEF